MSDNMMTLPNRELGHKACRRYGGYQKGVTVTKTGHRYTRATVHLTVWCLRQKSRASLDIKHSLNAVSVPVPYIPSTDQAVTSIHTSHGSLLELEKNLTTVPRGARH